MFHRLSAMDARYDEAETEYQFDAVDANGGYDERKFFEICKRYGCICTTKRIPTIMIDGHQNDHQTIQQKLRVITSTSTRNYDTYQCGDTTDRATDDTTERTIYARINDCYCDSYRDVAPEREQTRNERETNVSMFTQKFTRITVCNHDSYQE